MAYNTLVEVTTNVEAKVVRNRFRKNNPSSHMIEAGIRLHGFKTKEYFIFPMSRGDVRLKPQMCKIAIEGVKIINQEP